MLLQIPVAQMQLGLLREPKSSCSMLLQRSNCKRFQPQGARVFTPSDHSFIICCYN
jgi:hypothetical protein